MVRVIEVMGALVMLAAGGLMCWRLSRLWGTLGWPDRLLFGALTLGWTLGVARELVLLL